MRTPLLLAALSAAAPPLLGATASFDNDVAGQPPNGWTCGRTGKGTPRWTVEADGTAPSRPNVLRQAGEATFSWCVRDRTDTGTGQIEVKFKPISGKEDQAGGLVWRWKDGNNYYVARANALENNVALYYTVDGSRKTIKYADAPIAADTWHTLKVTYKDDAIQVSLDGKTYIDVNDAHIAGTGKVGVWTKADSVTLFDDFNALAP